MTDDIRNRLLSAYTELFTAYRDFAVDAVTCHARNAELRQQSEDAGLDDEARHAIMAEAGEAAKQGRGP